MRPKPATATPDGETCLVVTRSFHAARDIVWRAFTDPALLQLWLLGPPGWDMQECQMNVCAGGAYRWRWRNRELGDEFGFTGAYRIVDPGRRVADTQHFDHGPDRIPMGKPTQNELMFDDLGAATRVVSRITYATQDLRDDVMSKGMLTGMEASYAKLDNILPDIVMPGDGPAPGTSLH